MIDGIGSPTAPLLADVVDADTAVWNQLPGDRSGITTTISSAAFQATGDPQSICSAAIVNEDPNHYPWQGSVVEDTTVTVDGTSTRWLFCSGEAASGQGAVALWSENSSDWRFAALDFGRLFHGGDVLGPVVVDDRRASITYDSQVGEDHVQAFTAAGGATWTVTRSQVGG